MKIKRCYYLPLGIDPLGTRKVSPSWKQDSLLDETDES